MTELLASEPQKPSLGMALEEDLRDREAGDLGSADPWWSSSTAVLGQEIISKDVKCGEKGVEVGRARGLRGRRCISNARLRRPSPGPSPPGDQFGINHLWWLARTLSDSDVLGLLCATGVIPVIVADEINVIRPLGDALKNGGIRVAEITFRTAAAVEALRLLTLDPDLLVGAGTILRPDQVDLAYTAGARFIVTPGFSTRVIDRCRELGLPVVPGVATATELIAALDQGFELVKFFPAEASGGVAMIGALQGPFPDVRFIPTGGISAANAADYLAMKSVAAVGGNWMVASELLRGRDFTGIARLAAEAVEIAARARR